MFCWLKERLLILYLPLLTERSVLEERRLCFFLLSVIVVEFPYTGMSEYCFELFDRQEQIGI